MKDEFPLSWHSRAVKRTLAIAVLALVVLYFVVPKLHAFGLNTIKIYPPHLGYLVAAALLYLIVFICSSISYRLLAVAKLKQSRLLLIQFASVPINLLLPAGIGNISINYLYLRNHSQSGSQAGLVVGINNVIGVLGNVSLIIFLIAVFGINHSVLAAYERHGNYILAAIAALVVLGVITAWLFSSNIKKIKQIRHHLETAFSNYRHRPLNLFGAYVMSLVQALATALAFWFCLRAYGIDLSYAVGFLIYSLSVVVGALVPTPGGLGGVEASLTAGLVASHASAAALSLTAVLAYRAVTFWLPMIIGAFALMAVERLRLIRWRQ
ncbi:MAG: lysylphosphatidylglycerol synthase transmembrane domain-containing protein [Candidatus Saccharimonadales bacterium]